MAGTLTFVLAAALASSGLNASDAATSWPDCARAHAASSLENGVPTSWATTGSLPSGVAVQTISLGAFPPDAIHDAVYRILYLVPSNNSIYLEQTGGFGGERHLYGPISLTGHCPTPSGAPNNSFKPNPLRGRLNSGVNAHRSLS